MRFHLKPSECALLGGFLIHLVLGNSFVWGNITTSVTARIRKFEPHTTYNDTILIYALCLGSQGIFYFVSGYIETRLGSKFTCILGGYILIAGVFLSAYASTLFEYMLYSGFLCGAGYGIAFSPAVTTCVRWNPPKKGIISGIVLSGIGFGPFLFGLIANMIVNPKGLPTQPNKYFDSYGEVANRVPHMYFSLFVLYTLLMSLGCYLLDEPPSTNSNTISTSTSNSTTSSAVVLEEAICVRLCSSSNNNANKNVNTNNLEVITSIGPLQMLRLPISYHLISCFVMTSVGGLYFMGTFKTYGTTLLHKEDKLSSIGAYAAIANVCGRIFWGTIADSIGPTQALTILTFINSITLFSYATIAKEYHLLGFSIWTLFVFFNQGGNMCLYMPININLFGTKYASSNYGVIYMLFSWCNVANIIYLTKFKSDFLLASNGLGILTFIGCLNSYFLIGHYQEHRRKLVNTEE